MKLNQEQRYYIKQRIQTITSKKLAKIKTPQISVQYLQANPSYPDKVNAAIAILLTYQKEVANTYTIAAAPIKEKQLQAEEQLLFADSYEAVKELLKTFEESLINDKSTTVQNTMPKVCRTRKGS
jgi:hypothetical protein